MSEHVKNAVGGPADISVCVICFITDELCRSCKLENCYKLENVVIFVA